MAFAGFVLRRVILSRILADDRRADRCIHDARGLAKVQEPFLELRILSLGGEFPVSQEFSLVHAGIVHRRNRPVRIDADQVVHRELPFTGEISHGKRHLRIDLGRVRNQRSHRHRVMDATQLVLCRIVIVIQRFLDAFRGRNVRVGEHNLKRGGVDAFEPQHARICSDGVVTNVPVPAVAVELLGILELGEPPFIGQFRVAFHHVPERFRVSAEFKERPDGAASSFRFGRRSRRGQRTQQPLRDNPALQVAGRNLGCGQRIDRQARAIRIPCRRQRHERIVA